MFINSVWKSFCNFLIKTSQVSFFLVKIYGTLSIYQSALFLPKYSAASALWSFLALQFSLTIKNLALWFSIFWPSGFGLKSEPKNFSYIVCAPKRVSDEIKIHFQNFSKLFFREKNSSLVIFASNIWQMPILSYSDAKSILYFWVGSCRDEVRRHLVISQ